jgi:hypothetical protein
MYNYICEYPYIYSVFISVCVIILNAQGPTTSTKNARSFSLFIQNLKELQSLRSLDGSSVLHVVELFPPLPL